MKRQKYLNQMLQLYAQHIPDFNQKKDEGLYLQSAVKDLKDTNNLVETAKNQATFHKIMSVVLLSIGVAILATAILLACFLNPIFLLIALGGIITSTTSLVFSKALLGSIGDVIPLPVCIVEGFYVHIAFTAVKQLSKRKNDKITGISTALTRLKRIVDHNNVIRKSMQDELRAVDLTTAHDTAHLNRIKDLQNALKELEKAEALFNKIK